jgi:hypothetical protein
MTQTINERFAMKKTTLLTGAVAAGVVFGLSVSRLAAYTMVWETNKFDSDLGTWTLQFNNFANGNNVDWQNSANAGGTAGELGGRFADAVQTAYVARPLDFTVNLNDPLWFRGIVTITNTEQFSVGSGQDLNVWIGYFNTSDPNNNRMGWRTLTPSSTDPAAPFRGRARVNNGGNATGAIPMTQGVSYAFEARWQPNGDGLTGTFSGFIGSTSWNIANYSASNAGSYDAFGIFWSESAATPGLNYYIYFDNLEYLVPVPEPSVCGLGLLGVGALAASRALRRRRI